MYRNIGNTIAWMTVLVLLAFCRPAHAETIIKLGLGTDATPDISFNGTNLSTLADSDVPPTTGDQNTRVEFLGFLSDIPDINTPIASFTLADVAVSGPPTVVAGVVVVQSFAGGELFLYDPSDNLLLSGELDESSLTGPLGPPATGALFTTTFGMVTGGSLAPQIDPDTLTLSMSLTSVDNGSGFSITQTDNGPVLNSFDADVTLNIAALEVPEPSSLVMVLWVGLLALCRTRRLPTGQTCQPS